MNPTTINPNRIGNRQLHHVRRGILAGSQVYIKDSDRFPVKSGTFDKEVQNHFLNFAKDAKVFLDVGAAEGLYSVYMLKNTSAKVFVFDPCSDVSNSLLKNLEVNTRDGHRVHYGDDFISDSAGEGKTTIDLMTRQHSGPFFMHIDVDGTEADVLKGAMEVLDQEDTTIIMHVTSKESEQECMWILDEFGFDINIVGPAWWRSILRDRQSEEPNRWLIAKKSQVDGLTS